MNSYEFGLDYVHPGRNATASLLSEPFDASPLETEIQEHWQKLISQGQRLHEGEGILVVSNDNVLVNAETVCLRAQKSQYSYYRYVRDNPDKIPACYFARTVGVAMFLSTTDDIYAFGEMSKGTTIESRTVPSGGSLNLKDITPDG